MTWTQMQAGMVPVGGLTFYAGAVGDAAAVGTTAPRELEAQGWMICDGRTLPADMYPDLFAVIGHRYGGSGGQFCVPDYRGGTPFSAAARGGEPLVLIRYATVETMRVGMPDPVDRPEIVP